MASLPQEALRRRALGAPSARSMLFTVLGEYVLPRGGLAWSSTLVSALGALEVEEKTARQALARTAADGWLDRERIGRQVRWRLSSDARTLLRQGAERIYSFRDAAEGWDGRWVVLVTNARDAPRDARHRLRTRLAWAGFGFLGSGAWISPHAEREDEARRALAETGLEEGAVSFLGGLGEIGAEAELVAEAWDLESLEERYKNFVATFRRLRPRSDAATFAALTRLVHEWRRFPFLDPVLPRHLLPSRSGQVAHDLFGDRHAAWAPSANDWYDATG